MCACLLAFTGLIQDAEAGDSHRMTAAEVKKALRRGGGVGKLVLFELDVEPGPDAVE